MQWANTLKESSKKFTAAKRSLSQQYQLVHGCRRVSLCLFFNLVSVWLLHFQRMRWHSRKWEGTSRGVWWVKKCLLEDVTVLVSGTWDCHLMWQESGRRRHVSEASEMGDFLMVQRVLPPTPRIFISRRQREIWHKERGGSDVSGVGGRDRSGPATRSWKRQ